MLVDVIKQPLDLACAVGLALLPSPGDELPLEALPCAGPQSEHTRGSLSPACTEEPERAQRQGLHLKLSSPAWALRSACVQMRIND